ncbi:hypothetical protein HY501_00690 [Candidatus Woesearchaeota archaeon]|nr:hypothetical protein [Candidatus Woesearchaeota archaeon]
MDAERLEKLRKQSELARKEHERREALFLQAKKPSRRKYILIGSIIAALILGSLAVFSLATGPGPFDEFAKCLTQEGAVIYGNDFCSYTQKQKTFFGKSFKQLNYRRCADEQDLCKKKGIQVTPTWEIKGELYPEVQTFERLSAITGCAIS